MMKTAAAEAAYAGRRRENQQDLYPFRRLLSAAFSFSSVLENTCDQTEIPVHRQVQIPADQES